MKHVKTFEQFDYNIEEPMIEEGLFDGMVVSDFKKQLSILYSRDNISIDDKISKDIFNEVNNLKKSGEVKQIIGKGLNRAKRGVKLTSKIGDKDDLYYDAEIKSTGAGLK